MSMSIDLTGKTAVITGAARRIGREVALMLAAEGVDVVIHYRNSEDEARELAGLITGMGRRAWTLRADLSVGEEVDSLIPRAHELVGPINILINNASAFPRSTLATLTLESLMDSIKTDAWAPFALSREFAAVPGAEHIVNLLDTRVTSSYDWGHTGYLAAKHMLHLFTRMTAIKYAPGIAVNAVAPGLILPPEGKSLSYLENLSDELPLKRIGNPRQVAEAVLFLVSSEFITGQVIYIDGGRHLNEVT